MCFRRLRFDGVIEIDLPIGEKVITSSGTNLTTLNLAAGTYDRVEFDLRSDCASNSSGYSMVVHNANGNFHTSSDVSIRFDGNFVYDGSVGSLNLMIYNILKSLEAVTNDSQVQSAAEAASGDY